MPKNQERFPLLYALDLDDGDHPPSRSRDRNLLRGATSVIGTWPAAVSSTWRMIIGVVLCVLTVFLVVCVMFFLTSVCVPGAFPVPHYLGKRAAAAAACDLVDQAAFDEGGGLWNNLIPLETQLRFIRDERKVFFVKRERDPLTAVHVCAIRTAFQRHPNSTYLIVLVDTDNVTLQDEIAVLEELQQDRLDQQMNVMFIDADKYFNDTPLRGVYKREAASPLKVFAVRVVTLWRFGGVAYDLDLLTVKSALTTTTSPEVTATRTSPEAEHSATRTSPEAEPTPTRTSPEVEPTATRTSPEAEHTATRTSPEAEPTATRPSPEAEHNASATTTATAATHDDMNATIAADGTMIGARQPCHAFFFAVMKTLLKVAKRSSPTTVAEVMKLSLQSFCAGVEDGNGCLGVNVLPKQTICSTDQILNATSVAELTCNWAKVDENDATKRWAEKCPVIGEL